MGLVKMIVQLTINLVIVLVIIFFVPGLPPYTELEAVHPAPVRPLCGPLDAKGYVLIIKPKSSLKEKYQVQKA